MSDDNPIKSDYFWIKQICDWFINNHFNIIFAIIFGVGGYLLWSNTKPQEPKSIQELINTIKDNANTVIEDSTNVIPPKIDDFLKDYTVIKKDKIENILKAVALVSRQEAAEDYHKSFSIFVAMLALFGIGFPIIVAFIQHSFNEKQSEKIEQLANIASNASNKVESMAAIMNNATEKAEKTADKADIAASKADTAAGKADAAAIKADDAAGKADAAYTSAILCLNQAQIANTNANNASEQAIKANTNANMANEQVQKAIEQANNANEEMQKAIEQANNCLEENEKLKKKTLDISQTLYDEIKKLYTALSVPLINEKGWKSMSAILRVCSALYSIKGIEIQIRNDDLDINIGNIIDSLKKECNRINNILKLILNLNNDNAKILPLKIVYENSIDYLDEYKKVLTKIKNNLPQELYDVTDELEKTVQEAIDKITGKTKTLPLEDNN